MNFWSIAFGLYIVAGIVALLIVDATARRFNRYGFRDDGPMVLFFSIVVWPIVVTRFVGGCLVEWQMGRRPFRPGRRRSLDEDRRAR